MHISVIPTQVGIRTYLFHYRLKIKEKPSIWIPTYAGMTTVFCRSQSRKTSLLSFYHDRTARMLKINYHYMIDI
ncbi:hypothetical protein C4H52_09920 [Neisseria gonorrhoeae]